MSRKFRAYLWLPFASPTYSKVIEFTDDVSDEEINDHMKEEADELMFKLCSDRHYEEVK